MATGMAVAIHSPVKPAGQWPWSNRARIGRCDFPSPAPFSIRPRGIFACLLMVARMADRLSPSGCPGVAAFCNSGESATLWRSRWTVVLFSQSPFASLPESSLVLASPYHWTQAAPHLQFNGNAAGPMDLLCGHAKCEADSRMGNSFPPSLCHARANRADADPADVRPKWRAAGVPDVIGTRQINRFARSMDFASAHHFRLHRQSHPRCGHSHKTCMKRREWSSRAILPTAPIRGDGRPLHQFSCSIDVNKRCSKTTAG